MKYNDFHKICLEVLVRTNPLRSLTIFNHNSTQWRVKDLPTFADPLVRYYRNYNNKSWNEKSPIGFIIDRFVVEHCVESRYAEDDWDHFDIEYFPITHTPCRELQTVIKEKFPKALENEELMKKIHSMHQEKKYTYSTFTQQGGELYKFSYKSFKEIFLLLVEHQIIHRD